MKVKKLFLAVFTCFFSFSFVFVTFALAVATPPEFPSCVNPHGTVIADFSSGAHGVPGVVTAFQGADKVYAVSDGILIQCLCPVDGDGIQTNWWRIPALTSEEIESFTNQGWVFIPDGTAWGLEPVAYLAKNANFSCKAPSGGGGGGGVGGVGGAVNQIGEVLGLAVTGNIVTIYSLIIFGIIFLGLGYLLKEKNK